MRNAVKKHNRISQIGTQIHAGENYRRVVEWIRSGKLGQISVVRTFNVMNQGPDGHRQHARRRAAEGHRLGLVGRTGSDAAIQSADRRAGAYTHCSFMDFSGGWTPGMAPHIIDLPVWALELGYPTVTSSSSAGGTRSSDAGDAYDVQEVLWQYPGFTMTWMTSLTNSFGFRLRPRRAGPAAGHLLPRAERHAVQRLRQASGRARGQAVGRRQAAGEVRSRLRRATSGNGSTRSKAAGSRVATDLPLQARRADRAGQPSLRPWAARSVSTARPRRSSATRRPPG